MYLEYIKNNSGTQATVDGHIPFTKPSAIYGKLGKEDVKRFGVGKEYEEIIDSLWDCELTREDLFKFFRKDHDFYKGYIATLLWGGLGSDGKSRNSLKTALGYPKSEIVEKLTRVSSLLNDNKIDEAFESMLSSGKKNRISNKINGIGISFFTKLLYFLWPKENDQSLCPLIFDKWGWHIHAAILMEESGMDSVLKYYSVSVTISQKKENGLVPQIVLKNRKTITEAYLNYVKKIADYSNGNPGRLEEYLFGQSRKKYKSTSNPRVFLMQCLSKQIHEWMKSSLINYSLANEETEESVEQ